MHQGSRLGTDGVTIQKKKGKYPGCSTDIMYLGPLGEAGGKLAGNTWNWPEIHGMNTASVVSENNSLCSHGFLSSSSSSQELQRTMILTGTLAGGLQKSVLLQSAEKSNAEVKPGTSSAGFHHPLLAIFNEKLTS